MRNETNEKETKRNIDQLSYLLEQDKYILSIQDCLA